MDPMLRDAAAYLARVVGSWDEVLVRVMADAFVAAMSVVLLHPIFRIRWKPLGSTGPRSMSVRAKVLEQKGFRAMLLNLPAIMAIDLVLLITSVARGFYIAPKSGRDAEVK